MRLDGPPRPAPGVACPYLPDRVFVQEHFFGDQVAPDEASLILEAGWRHFGSFFFRPQCPTCRACEPLRVDAQNLKFSDSQRRVWNKNSDVKFVVGPLEYRPEYYALYEQHSRLRFGKETDEAEFRQSFFEPALPSFVTEYRIGGELAALGFCDESTVGLSSVYFVFAEQFASRSLGVYSVLRECELARQKGLRWYFLGYHVPGNATMAYKNRFHPRQVLDWTTGVWQARDEKTSS